MELISLSGRPFFKRNQVTPLSVLLNPPSRDATRICASGVTVTPRIPLMFPGKLACCQVVPPSVETTTSLRVAATSNCPLDRTATESLLPSTGPPIHVFPSLELVNNPTVVAASQRCGVTSISFTFASRVVCGTGLATAFFPFFAGATGGASLTMVLLGRHALPA